MNLPLILTDSQLRQSVESFIKDLTSEHTRIAYAGDLQQFAEWLESATTIKSITEIQRVHIINYKEYLKKSGREHTTIDRKLSTLKSFFKWLHSDRVILADPTDGVKFLKPKRESRTNDFTDSEVKRVLARPDTSTNVGLQHFAILMVLFYCGLRRSELCHLKIGNLTESQGLPILKFVGKRNIERIVTLPKEVMDAIDEYLILTNREKAKREEYLFTDLKMKDFYKPMDPSTIYRIVVRYAREAGIKKRVSPHSCRATAISNARDHQVPDRAIQAFAGWTTPGMITRYDKRKTSVKECASLAIEY